MRFSFGEQDADVEAVNRSRDVAVLNTGEQINITNWLDAFGEECAIDDAVVAVAGPDRLGRWFAIDLSAFEPTVLH